MLEGWYCRSLANQKTKSNKTEREQQESEDEHHPSSSVPRALPAAMSSTSTAHSSIDYKERYRNMKRKLKFLIYVSRFIVGSLFISHMLSLCNDRRTSISRICYIQINDVC